MRTSTGHRNDMTLWPDIACQRGHTRHAHKTVSVRLGGLTGYTDFPPVPQRLAREFAMEIWDPAAHPVDGGPYCPAHDAVSETIAQYGVWEPRETIVALDLFASAERGEVFLDLGAQIGWFSLLALSSGLDVLAYDAEHEQMRMLDKSARINGWHDRLRCVVGRIGAGTEPLWVDRDIALAKIDIEGAEPEAIEMLRPAIEGGRVRALLVEVTPVFHDGYPALVCGLVEMGYGAYLLPEKQRPPVTLAEKPGALLVDLEPLRLDAKADLAGVVAGWHQENVLFIRQGAA